MHIKTLMAPLAALGLLTLAPAARAASGGVLYDCDITQLKRGGGYISEKLAIVLDQNGKATISDGMILHVYASPIEADMVRKNDRRLFVGWTVAGFVNSHNQLAPIFEYQATIKKNGKISVYARPDGYPDRFSGEGTCKKRTG
ncbi:hypothetical protein ACOTTU_01295 [Roseobacter sp. EG26]